MFSKMKFAAMTFAAMSADADTSAGSVAEANESDEKSRAEAVEDATIIEAYLVAANNKDKDGNIVGTLADVAEATGMNPGSLNGRLTSLRKILPENALPKLARSPAKEGAKNRKKNPQDVLALFNKINSGLGKPANVEAESNEGEADSDEG